MHAHAHVCKKLELFLKTRALHSKYRRFTARELETAQLRGASESVPQSLKRCSNRECNLDLPFRYLSRIGQYLHNVRPFPLQKDFVAKLAANGLLAFSKTAALGSRPAPGTPTGKRSAGTRRTASMQETLAEGTARASNAAGTFSGHRHTASAVGASGTRGVVG